MRTTGIGIVVGAFLVPLVLAPVAAGQIGSTEDLWDTARGAEVLDHSPFDDTHHGYDARDAFGGDFHDFPAALGAVIFADFMPAGTAHWIEWRPAAAMDLERFTVSVSADHNGEDLRATSGFRLFGRDEPGAPWMLLFEATRTREAVLAHPEWMVDHEFRTPRRGVMEFRAEFVQASGRTDYGGPRVWELDGFGEYSLGGTPRASVEGEAPGVLVRAAGETKSAGRGLLRRLKAVVADHRPGGRPGARGV